MWKMVAGVSGWKQQRVSAASVVQGPLPRHWWWKAVACVQGQHVSDITDVQVSPGVEAVLG